MTDQIIVYEKVGDSAVIRRCFSHEDTAVIPELLEHAAVTEIGAYAFSAHADEDELFRAVRDGRWKFFPKGNYRLQRTESGTGLLLPDQEFVPALCGERLLAVCFPKTVGRTGRYCFYNCIHLEQIEISVRMSDWGSGVFTGCHRLKRIRVYADPAEPVRLKGALDELPDPVTVKYIDSAGNPVLRLVFPEFYEEGVENTPARILMTEVHGSGIRYRNSFRRQIIDLSLYDSLFPYAVAEEPFPVTSALASGRLRYPWGLSGEARERYYRYCRKNWKSFASQYLADHSADDIRWLAEEILKENPEDMDQFLALALEARAPETVSYLLDRRRSSGGKKPSGRKRMEWSVS